MKRQAAGLFFVLTAVALLFGYERLQEWGKAAIGSVLPGGFVVTYYDLDSFEQPVARRSERFLVKDYGMRRPVRGLSADSFSARWSGWLFVPAEGEYSFFLQSQGAVRVYFGDEQVMERPAGMGWFEGTRGRAWLEGGSIPVVIEHEKVEPGSAAIRLRWTGGPIPPNTTFGVPYVTKRMPSP